jgi:hypothetical protein
MSGRHLLGSLIVSRGHRCAVTLFCLAMLLGSARAQDAVAVPPLIRFSGTISGAPAGISAALFALYKDQTGGAPLWQEVQNLTLDASGRYSALLGLRSAAGIPLELFANGEARWLAVQPDGQPEQPRVLLVSVPYALKSGDAETLGGLPASAFLRSAAVTLAALNSTPIAAPNNAVPAATNSATTKAHPADGDSGATAGYLPVFSDAGGDLSNSRLAQAGKFVGIGTAAPEADLNIVDSNPTLRLDNYSNTLGDSPNFNFITARGTPSAPLPTRSGDNLGQFAAAGYNGSAFPGSKVKVSFVATEDWTPAANGTAMSFSTTTNGSTTRTERLRIDNTGNVGIGTAAPAFPLSVKGVIQTTGGILFPDGSTQTSAALAGTVGIASGGTGATTAATARANLGAASSGANGDITALTGLAAPLPVSEGGTGSATQNFVDLGNPQTIVGAKTFSSTINGSISGNAATAALATTAASVLNGVYTTGSYPDPAWLTSLNAGKLTGTLATQNLPASVALTNAANTFTAGTQDFSGADATLPVRALLSAATPATCVASKELLLKTDATPGQQLFLCNSTGNGWVLLGGGSVSGGSVTGFNARTGYVTSQPGDYAFSQIGGAVADSQIAGMSAAKLVGSVSVAQGGTGATTASAALANLGGASTQTSNTFVLPQTINVGSSGNVGLTVEADSTGSGSAPNAIFATTSSGDPTANAIFAVVTDPFSAASAITAQTSGQGVPIYAISTNQTYQVAAIVGQVASNSGVGVQGVANSTTGNTIGVLGQTFSPNGVAVMGSGVAQTCTTSSGSVTCVPVPGNGIGGEFQTSKGGTLLLGQVVDQNFNTTNVFRVDATGKGFFDGGTATGGADFAESVEVAGDVASYAPGDLMSVDPTGDRRFQRVAQSYSTLVAGIYATKPGILATPHTMNDPRLASEIPLAMVGIVPCKVTAENGPIHRGDLLVSSSTAGRAMKGTDHGRMLGAVVGKALGSLDQGTGTIEVLVTLQ